MKPTRNPLHAQITWLALLDAMCLVTAVVAGVWIRDAFGRWGVFGLDPLISSASEYLRGHVGGWIYFAGSIILANYLAGSYGIQLTTSRFNLLVNWIFSLLVALFVLSLTSYAWFRMLLGRGILVTAVCVYGLLSLTVKSLVYRVILRSELFVQRSLILGAGDRAREARERVESRYVIPPHRVCGFIEPVEGPASRGGRTSATLDGLAVIDGNLSTLEEIVSSFDVNLLVIALDNPGAEAEYYPVLRRLRFAGVEIMDPLAVAENYDGKVPLDLVDNRWLMRASMEPSLIVVGRLKRIFDLFVSIVVGIPFIPLGVLIALIIKISAPRSPVFFCQKRVGQLGRVFRMWKFRSMIERTGDAGREVWAQEDDPRITRLGRILRRFRLDEIPQFLNVLRGDMSVVGPRPEQPEIVLELEKKIRHYREREIVPPGLTGWAQVQYPYTDSVEDAAHKLEYDFYYIKNLSMRLDLQIILRTIRIVLLGKERKI